MTQNYRCSTDEVRGWWSFRAYTQKHSHILNVKCNIALPFEVTCQVSWRKIPSVRNIVLSVSGKSLFAVWHWENEQQGSFWHTAWELSWSNTPHSPCLSVLWFWLKWNYFESVLTGSLKSAWGLLASFKSLENSELYRSVDDFLLCWIRK